VRRVGGSLTRYDVAMRKYSEGHYDRSANILHVWYPRGVQLQDEATVEAFFDETKREWLDPCPTPPYLLVNYAGVHIAPNMADCYARSIGRFQGLVLGTFRYGMSRDASGHFTAVAVALGNIRLAAPSNLFESEEAARKAIESAKSGSR
jgi:uncharacterized protein YegP (UPF0339 family)